MAASLASGVAACAQGVLQPREEPQAGQGGSTLLLLGLLAATPGHAGLTARPMAAQEVSFHELLSVAEQSKE